MKHSIYKNKIMYSLVHRVKTLSLATSGLGSNALPYQVRWRRKPRWLPTARSKLFKVPTRPTLPQDEKEELKKVTNNYRTQIKSIRRYLTFRYGTAFQASADPEQQKRIFEEDLTRCMEINEKWNAEQKVLREARVAKDLEGEIEFAKNRLLLEVEKQERLTKEADEIVRKLEAESKTFITRENIDAAIEHAIASPVDYNFALDLKGNKIEGRYTKPGSQDKKTAVQN